MVSPHFEHTPASAEAVMKQATSLTFPGACFNSLTQCRSTQAVAMAFFDGRDREDSFQPSGQVVDWRPKAVAGKCLRSSGASPPSRNSPPQLLLYGVLRSRSFKPPFSASAIFPLSWQWRILVDRKKRAIYSRRRKFSNDA